jgi:hypothetical protein
MKALRARHDMLKASQPACDKSSQAVLTSGAVLLSEGLLSTTSITPVSIFARRFNYWTGAG